MRHTVRQQRLDAAVREQHLDPPDAPRRRVSLQRRGEILANFSYHPAQGAHGAKNGVLM
jgi:hypothetical protein